MSYPLTWYSLPNPIKEIILAHAVVRDDLPSLGTVLELVSNNARVCRDMYERYKSKSTWHIIYSLLGFDVPPASSFFTTKKLHRSHELYACWREYIIYHSSFSDCRIFLGDRKVLSFSQYMFTPNYILICADGHETVYYRKISEECVVFRHAFFKATKEIYETSISFILEIDDKFYSLTNGQLILMQNIDKTSHNKIGYRGIYREDTFTPWGQVPRITKKLRNQKKYEVVCADENVDIVFSDSSQVYYDPFKDEILWTTDTEDEYVVDTVVYTEMGEIRDIYTGDKLVQRSDIKAMTLAEGGSGIILWIQ